MPLYRCQHEPRKPSRRMRSRILPGTEDVEVANADILEAIDAAENLRVEFADIFCDPVRRNRVGLHGLGFRKRWGLTIGAGGSGVNRTAHFGISRCHQDVQSAINIYVVSL